MATGTKAPVFTATGRGLQVVLRPGKGNEMAGGRGKHAFVPVQLFYLIEVDGVPPVQSQEVYR